jgi:hypothetical protein
MANKMNLLGERFGYLTVTGKAPSISRNTYWICKCDCGNEITCKTKSLRLEGKTSCGCDTFDKRSEKLKTHGLSKTSVYKSWSMMKSRCNNPEYSHYSYYGGRGITVCKEWEESFEVFLEDMGPKPEGFTLDRIDNEKGYYKENCKWSTREEQVDNRRNKVNLTLNSLTFSVKEWAEILGVKRSQIYLALYNGATLEGYINKRNLIPRLLEHPLTKHLNWN